MNRESTIAQINEKLKELDGENLDLILLFVDTYIRKLQEV